MLSELIWHGLLANLAILVIFVSFATHSYNWRARWPEPWRALSLGVTFGVGAIVLMLFPVEVTPGLYSDLRAALIALAGFFGGPVSGIVAGIIGGLYRFSQGGAGGVPGTFGIAFATSIGIIGHLLVRRRAIRKRDIFILGASVGLVGAAGVLMLPPELRMRALSSTTIPAALLVFASTVVAGLAMLQERQRREAFEENRIYRTIIETLPDILNVKDLKGRFIAANPATARLLGAESPEALVGRTDFDFFEEETAKGFRTDEQRVLGESRPVTLEQEFDRPDGSKVWLSTLKAPVLDQDGKPIALITHNRDITERKHLEDDLAVTQERFAAAMDQMADGLAMFDPQARLIFCNELYRSFFPKTAHLRVPGTSLRTILRAAVETGEQIDIPPDRLDGWIEEITDRTLHVPDEQEVHRFDDAWLHIRSTPMRDGSAMVVISDITKIKQAESSRF